MCSGDIDVPEARGGTLALNSHKATVDMPLVFREALEFDSLTAQVAWTGTTNADGVARVALVSVRIGG